MRFVTKLFLVAAALIWMLSAYLEAKLLGDEALQKPDQSRSVELAVRGELVFVDTWTAYLSHGLSWAWIGIFLFAFIYEAWEERN